VQPARWFGVGSAEGTERRAGARAAAEALAGDEAKLLVVFSSPLHDLTALLAQIRTCVPDVPLIGCTTAGEIATTGPRDASVVVVALGGDGFAVQTAVATDASRDLRAAGARVAECVPTRHDLPHRVLLLLTDGLAGDQQEIVRGAYSVTGAGMPFVGGCAGDDLKMAQTFQFYDDRVLTDSVVGAVIASAAPLGIGVRNGWQRIGEPMLVTGSSGNRLHTLDDRPALDVYLEHVAVDKLDSADQEALARLSLRHPLGLSRLGNEEQVRFISGGDFDERSLSCLAEVPQGALVWIMEGDERSVLEATDAAGRDALAAIDGRPPLGMIVFDCIARRSALGSDPLLPERH